MAPAASGKIVPSKGNGYMTDPILEEIACPNCQIPIDVREHGAHVVCDACGSRFILRGRLCPHCNNYHEQEQDFCTQCGEALTRVCRHCGGSNWAGDEYCAACGAALDIFDLLALQDEQARHNFMEERRRQIRQMRELEELASEKRMEELQAIEEARQADVRRRLAQQRRQEQRLLLAVFAGVALFLLLLIIYAAATLLFT